MLRALYGGKPPLEAYPRELHQMITEQEQEIEERRNKKDSSA